MNFRILPSLRLLFGAVVLAMSGLGSSLPVAAQALPPSTLVQALQKPVPESPADLRAIQTRVQQVVQKVMPSVVAVRVGPSQGSGVIISADGYVLTAGHVTGGSDKRVVVTLPDGTEVRARSLGVDRRMDSGVVKITGKGPWPYTKMGDSKPLIEGQWCIAIGHPGGYRSGRDPVVRVGRIVENAQRAVRTDCALVGGDSGGPLFDMDGKVIGIHSRIGKELTMNHHVPVNTYRNNWDRLVQGAPYYGFRLKQEDQGVRIVEVVQDTPAEKAAFQDGDLILAFENTEITDLDQLRSQIKAKRPGDRVRFKVARDNLTLEIEMTVGRRLQ